MDTSEIQTSLEGLVGALGDGLSQYGPGLLGGLVILVVGWAIANWARRGLDRALGRYPRMDVTLRRFLASLVKWIILAVTFVAVLGQFGVQTTSLLAVLGAAGLAIGLALQGTLSWRRGSCCCCSGHSAWEIMSIWTESRGRSNPLTSS